MFHEPRTACKSDAHPLKPMRPLSPKGSLSQSEYDLEAGKASAPTPTPTGYTTRIRYTYCSNWRIFVGSMVIINLAALLFLVVNAANRHRESPPSLRAGGTIILD